MQAECKMTETGLKKKSADCDFYGKQTKDVMPVDVNSTEGRTVI